MKYNIGDLICWTYPGDELSTIIEHYIDWEEKDRYVVITYHRNADEYIRDSFSEEEMDRFIQGKVIKHYPVK
jgi:hypothetical protein